MSELKYIEYNEKTKQTTYIFDGLDPLKLKIFDKAPNVKELEEKLKLATKALEFYDNWKIYWFDKTFHDYPILQDGGKTAREALGKLRE